MSSIFKHTDNLSIQNNTFSATVHVCRDTVEGIVRECMTLGHKMTVNDYGVNKFAERVAQLLESSLRVAGTALNHCEYVRQEILKARAKDELEIACRWVNLKSQLITQLNALA